MLWHLKHGDTAKDVAIQAQRMGRPFPAWLANAPELIPGSEVYWTAFQRLNRSRNFNGVIQWDAIHDYCVRNDFDEELTDDMIEVITRLDDAYTKWIEANKKD